MSDFLKRTWAEIDLDAIRHNFQVIEASLAPGSRAMAVVKADAYGHGAGYVSRALQEAGASWFGVSNLDEAMQIRNAGIVEPILILAYTPPEEAAPGGRKTGQEMEIVQKVLKKERNGKKAHNIFGCLGKMRGGGRRKWEGNKKKRKIPLAFLDKFT